MPRTAVAKHGAAEAARPSSSATTATSAKEAPAPSSVLGHLQAQPAEGG